jgi:hypothetical protein
MGTVHIDINNIYDSIEYVMEKTEMEHFCQVLLNDPRK